MLPKIHTTITFLPYVEKEHSIKYLQRHSPGSEKI